MYTELGAASEQAVDLAVMSARVAQLVAEGGDTQVYIRADQAADYASVVAGIAALQQGGVSSLGLVTEAPQ